MKEAGRRNGILLLAVCFLLAAGGCAAGLGNRDRDRDGIKDSVDVDPFKAEDMDGFEDEDGLPEKATLPGSDAIPAAEPPPSQDVPGPELATRPEIQAPGPAEVQPAEPFVRPSRSDTLELDDACFDAGEISPSPFCRDSFDRIGRIMVDDGHARLIVRACVDTVGTFLIDQSLAEFRARSVMDYFVDIHGIRSSRITIDQVYESFRGGPPRGRRHSPIDCRIRIILLQRPD